MSVVRACASPVRGGTSVDACIPDLVRCNAVTLAVLECFGPGFKVGSPRALAHKDIVWYNRDAINPQAWGF